jgi:hypothetical protein
MEQADIESLAVEPDLEVDGGNQGTLGGLVEVTRRFSGILKSALNRQRLCSSDPVCADHDPASADDDRTLHGAACHGCLLVAETSCEAKNLFLDRALLVDTVGTMGLGSCKAGVSCCQRWRGAGGGASCPISGGSAQTVTSGIFRRGISFVSTLSGSFEYLIEINSAKLMSRIKGCVRHVAERP